MDGDFGFWKTLYMVTEGLRPASQPREPSIDREKKICDHITPKSVRLNSQIAISLRCHEWGAVERQHLFNLNKKTAEKSRRRFQINLNFVINVNVFRHIY